MLLIHKVLEPNLCYTVLKLLSIIQINTKIRITSLHGLCHSLVHVYFTTLINTTADTKMRNNILHLTETVMSSVCDLRFGLQIMLRFILEASINSSFATNLGSKPFLNSGDQNSHAVSVKRRDTAKLFRENLKFGSMPVQPLGASTVFHAGIIGKGKTVGDDLNAGEVCEETAVQLREHVTGVMFRLCKHCGNEEEGYKKLALQLVEVVSPDIMYNGIPWPEEEFMKVTMERDLQITRMLENHPILWTLMEMLARHKPALSYCSVLVRGVMCVCISHWQSTATSHLTNFPHQVELTRRVVTLMGIAQFIPGHLAILANILDMLEPGQLNCILVDIWNFMKVNVPGPSSYAVGQNRNFGPYSDFKPYCDRLRMVMLANLEKVSDLFKLYFVDSVVREYNSTNQQSHQNGAT